MWGCLVNYLVALVCLTSGTLTERDLQQKLFENYLADARPRVNGTAAIVVTLDLTLLSIAEINEKEQTFKVRAFLEVKWNDKFLFWKPKFYGGIKSINVPNSKIWQPDLALLDTYDSLTDIGQLGGNAVVDYQGNVMMWPYKMYTVCCKIKVRHFPFDTQTCHLDFLSWSNPMSVLDLRTTKVQLNMDRYSENEEWHLEEADITYWQQPYGADAWAHVKYTFTLRRKWLFYALTIIAPIMCISLLNVTTFLLPAASGEKITLCISTFLTLAVFMTIITNSLPESSEEISILGWYVGLQLLGNGTSILCTVITLRLYTKDSNDPMPRYVKFLCKMCCQKPRDKFVSADARNSRDSRGSHGNSGRRSAYDRKMSTVSTNVSITIQENDMTWVSASNAFDCLCLCVAVCWHLGLFIGLVVGYME